ncbi:unnamed protein product [Clavelina lepadiformis]|uniref:Uncharacterized protein n=1 Tax=Clavelina lepadiformis TaxID=159417 RepID=A0ABP0G1P4_CLALP
MRRVFPRVETSARSDRVVMGRRQPVTIRSASLGGVDMAGMGATTPHWCAVHGGRMESAKVAVRMVLRQPPALGVRRAQIVCCAVIPSVDDT